MLVQIESITVKQWLVADEQPPGHKLFATWDDCAKQETQ
jgi:hypothetical protein